MIHHHSTIRVCLIFGKIHVCMFKHSELNGKQFVHSDCVNICIIKVYARLIHHMWGIVNMHYKKKAINIIFIYAISDKRNTVSYVLTCVLVHIKTLASATNMWS